MLLRFHHCAFQSDITLRCSAQLQTCKSRLFCYFCAKLNIKGLYEVYAPSKGQVEQGKGRGNGDRSWDGKNTYLYACGHSGHGESGAPA